MRTLKISLLVFILSTAISAQWEWINPKPQANNLKKICFLDSSTGWIVGTRGTFLNTNLDSTWQVKYFEGIEADLNSLTFEGDNLGWAVSAVVGVVEEGRVFKTSDGGETWSQIYIFNKDLYDVKFVSEDVGWVVGFGIISKTTDGGLSWNDQLSDPMARFYTCYFADSLKGWAAGYVGSEVYHTEDGGITWNRQSLNPAGTYYSITFSDSNNGWIAGRTVNNYLYASLYRSTDGGSSWFEYQMTGTALNTIFFINDSVGWISQGSNILKTSNGGNSWFTISSLGSSIDHIFFANPTKGWLINPYGIIRETTDGGYNWVSQNSGFSYDIGSAFFLDSLKGTIVKPSGNLMLTDDGAKTWTVSYSPPPTSADYLHKIKFVDSLYGWVCGYREPYSCGLILKTIDGGQSWSASTPSVFWLGGHLYDVEFIDRQTGFSGNTDLCKTTDGGLNWSNVLPNTDVIFDIFFLNSSIGWVSSGSGKIYKTEDTGNTWNLIGSGQDTAIYTLYFKDEFNGWAGGWGGLFMSTTDGGYTWQKYSFGMWAFESIQFKDQQNGYVIGVNNLYTTDGGLTWQSFWIPSESALHSFQFVHNKIGWFTGVHGTILKYYCDEPSSIEIEEYFNSYFNYSLSQNYPNPFNPSTVISYRLPVIGFVTLKVYDLLGREIATLVSEEKPAGEYEVEFNIANLSGGISAKGGYASGVYFYQLKAGQYSETRKMVLLK